MMDPKDLLIDTESGGSSGILTGLIPWLPKPHRCDCGTYCTPSTEYIASQASYEDVWVCPECGTMYYREPDTTYLTGNV